ncbi:MAG: hypothetical protein OXP09_04765 [Gammaproteobacteria bacterium]|nr:hypothetical protein [Gammaproteobacteria bacterium]MDE0364866.1 hypothetical protein [Gammaproteobacteria bacterium]
MNERSEVGKSREIAEWHGPGSRKMMRFRQNDRTGNARRRSIAWLSLAGLIFLSAGIQGAQDETEGETGQHGEVSEAAEGAPGDGETASAEVFQPTEEISEDYAAPFPVDI